MLKIGLVLVVILILGGLGFYAFSNSSKKDKTNSQLLVQNASPATSTEVSLFEGYQKLVSDINSQYPDAKVKITLNDTSINGKGERILDIELKTEKPLADNATAVIGKTACDTLMAARFETDAIEVQNVVTEGNSLLGTTKTETKKSRGRCKLPSPSSNNSNP